MPNAAVFHALPYENVIYSASVNGTSPSMSSLRFANIPLRKFCLYLNPMRYAAVSGTVISHSIHLPFVLQDVPPTVLSLISDGSWGDVAADVRSFTHKISELDFAE